MYVYIKSEPNLWTVGFYSPDGKWNPESDWGSKDLASQRVIDLNGGDLTKRVEALEQKVKKLEGQIMSLRRSTHLLLS